MAFVRVPYTIIASVEPGDRMRRRECLRLRGKVVLTFVWQSDNGMLRCDKEIKASSKFIITLVRVHPSPSPESTPIYIIYIPSIFLVLRETVLDSVLVLTCFELIRNSWVIKISDNVIINEW